MADTTRIVVVSAGLGVPSSSRLLADQLAAATERLARGAGFSPAVTMIELRDLAVDIANNFVTGYQHGYVQKVVAAALAAPRPAPSPDAKQAVPNTSISSQ